jgi:hypothetical protein
VALDKNQVSKIAGAILKAMDGQSSAEMLGLLACIAASLCRKSGCEPDTFVELFSASYENAGKR